MKQGKKHIFLTNDDGIDSPGLLAAAEALSDIGYVTVAAPRDHMSATGRGFAKESDGRIIKKKLIVKGQEWDVYAIGGSPSQSVMHGLLEVVSQRPDLVVVGINYGVNFATDITYSGTVGAAIEAASLGIPALAISLQIIYEDYNSYQEDVDFSVAAHFTRFFTQKLLEKELPDDVDILNVVVPEGATRQTPWKVTQLAKMRYFHPYVVREGKLEDKGYIRSNDVLKDEEIPPDNDVYAVRIEKMVAVTPLSLDMTSRVPISFLDTMLRSK
jgi:5'-nucleotidase